MKLLTFLARSFAWQTFSKTLPEVPDMDVSERVEDAVIVFMHIEARDIEPEARARAFRHTLKHIKWLANKRGQKTIVLHSFSHLGGANAPPEQARQLMSDLAERLGSTGYTVHMTPFGYFCSWSLDVHGESLAKVWKEI